MIFKNKEGSVFVNLVALIGAILIFIGVAWLIAKNWHQIPNAIKVMILVFSTLSAFIFGVLLRQYKHEGVGRALITLGALLYILSLFLISQIYHLATTPQHYAWLLFFAWIIIFVTAYFLNSPENLIVSIIVFFFWVILQYSSFTSIPSLKEGLIFGFILIFLWAGALLYGLSVLHGSIKHRFTKIYSFWTIFYFLLIFYILSFQSTLPVLSESSFESTTFSVFLVLFIILCFFVFITGMIFAASKKVVSLKEILGFLVVFAVLFIMIISTKAGAGLMGTCYEKNCYDFKTSAECSSAPEPLICKWQDNHCGYWEQAEGEQVEEVEAVRIPLSKTFYDICSQYNNQKSKCLNKKLCKWQPSYGFWKVTEGLPTILWFLWIVNNFVFIGFIILILFYGQYVGSTKIVNLGLIFFILEIITRYIGFWFDFRGYFAFSVLAILGGLLLIFGAWLIPKWRRNFIKEIKHNNK